MRGHEYIRKGLREFYDEIAENFSSTRKYWWRDLNFIRKYLKSEGKVLDFGCGNGRLVDFLKETNLEYVGVDASEKLIEIAKREYPKESFLQIENEKALPFKDAEFDMVFSIAVFHHFTPKMTDNALREIKRVLKKDGILILTIWNLWNIKHLKFLFKSFLRGNFNLSAKVSFKYRNETKWRFCYWWTKEKIVRKMKNFKFKVIDCGYTFGQSKKTKKEFKRNIFVVAGKE
jgi:ubiquinone/menaquinone biosynthesis C-methylase UbiE